MKHKHLFLPFAALLAGCAGHKTEMPNVVFILADDLGYGDLGCYGAKGVETPNVDGLASQGIRCTDAHAVASTSTPSRYSLLTGQYPWRKTGTDVAAGNAKMIISPDQFTVADMLKSQGYSTGAVGKWHLGLGSETGKQDWNGKLDEDLSDIGFDYHYIMAATSDRVPCVFIENGRVVNHDPGRALWKDETIADSLTAHAVRFIEENANKPFFLYFATNDIHVPRFPADRFRGASTMGLRGDAIAQFDWSVGEILNALERLGLEKNTIVVLTSDNGPVLDDGYDDKAEELVGDHKPAGPWRGGKYSAYEGGTAIPLIIRWPGHIKAGKEDDRIISQIDGFRSLANLLGAEIPAGAAPDSRDFKDAEYVMEMSNDHTISVCDEEWKYISPSNGPEMIQWGPKIETGYRPFDQLFERQADPGETENVAGKHPEIVERFKNIVREQR